MQKNGIASGNSADLEDLTTDESLYERGALVKVVHPVSGLRVGPGLPWRMSRVKPIHTAAPLLGQDDHYVLCDLLGMTEEEVAVLTAEGALG
jgi:crotonobetainyl-CoA:carnitine CoA-transferase CaiB-like acyl-CoA transferase